ncbi:uncharacterized protein RHIMIDRAFT_138102 [Rhizopus microsporus ATCC 52813]|uniref:Uncharacterized protein n=1 Tax=Rhizopus microsporus ATCC 52813 TaxID=1340429 RepID=A0A2G4ST57_RHIZD|nr:uncharacterized protein RHIMIDRAFT_138102 [Rhizopus microsporus ATCC 52813]PHZ11949.1 hypothetical protein RHIMIDRAFT_138102 [Rhizopus microsporus ATCC 52813]
MALYLTFRHCPELFYWVKLRRVSRKIHTFISSIFNIFLYVLMLMNGCIIHHYISVSFNFLNILSYLFATYPDWLIKIRSKRSPYTLTRYQSSWWRPFKASRCQRWYLNIGKKILTILKSTKSFVYLQFLYC